MKEKLYKIYGVTVQSAFSFSTKLEESQDDPDLCFFYSGIDEGFVPEGCELEGAESANGTMKLYNSPQGETVLFPNIAALVCTPFQIQCYCLNRDAEFLIEICFMGNVLSYWLERRGTIMLHAFSVMVSGKAVAFIAGKNRGKTTTACSFIHEGYHLIFDDILSFNVKDSRIIFLPVFPR